MTCRGRGSCLTAGELQGKMFMPTACGMLTGMTEKSVGKHADSASQEGRWLGQVKFSGGRLGAGQESTFWLEGSDNGPKSGINFITRDMHFKFHWDNTYKTIISTLSKLYVLTIHLQRGVIKDPNFDSHFVVFSPGASSPLSESWLLAWTRWSAPEWFAGQI